MRTRLQQKVPVRSLEALLEDVSVGRSLSLPGDNQGTAPGLCHPCPEPTFKLGRSSAPSIFACCSFFCSASLRVAGREQMPGSRQDRQQVAPFAAHPAPSITGMWDALADAGPRHPGTSVAGRSQGYTDAT